MREFTLRGQINPFIAGPVAAGVMIGATLGSRACSAGSRAARCALVFVLVLIVISGQMLWKGIFLK